MIDVEHDRALLEPDRGHGDALLAVDQPGGQALAAGRELDPEGQLAAGALQPGPPGAQLELGRLGGGRGYGEERIAVPAVRLEEGSVVFDIDHYDSAITAAVSDGGRRLSGEWQKRSGADSWARLPFEATAGAAPRFGPAEEAGSEGHALTGRWAVDFSSSEDPAVAELVVAKDGTASGTFLTTTGDYRFLAGSLERGLLRLSCFDGAHAFLFRALVQEDGSLAGDFWSRDSWHETWTARPDPEAALPDPFEETRWLDGASAAQLVYPDLEGAPRSLADPAFAGKARILQVFGSWCPNCHDETAYLAELHRRYRDRGLSVLGLAFELSGEFERDAAQVRTFARRHGVEYPILVAGTSDKGDATQAFPLIDRVRSYPTTIFLHRDGRVRAVHSGWAGPATGAEHEALVQEFESLVQELLDEPERGDRETWKALADFTWFDWSSFAGATYRFEAAAADERRARRRAVNAAGEVEEEQLTAELQGDALLLDGELWHLDRRAFAILDPRDFERRLTPQGRTVTPLLRKLEIAIGAGLQHEDPLVRREAVVAYAYDRDNAHKVGLPGFERLFADPDVGVRTAVAWAVGFHPEPGAVPLLLEQLESPNAALRREAARALGRVAGTRAEVRERLAALASDPDPLVRAAAERVLGS